MAGTTLVLGRCQPKQHEFMMAHERYVAYGGARGGGKSWALREKAKRLALKWPGIRILIIRKNLDDLRQNHINPLRHEIPEAVARYRELDKTFYFANGSTLKMAYFKTDHDADKFQGQEYDIIGIDEATQLLEHTFVVLKACLRGANNFPKRIYLTCNPGGVGHAWVKRLFIDRDFLPNENGDDYAFIQALVDDNPKLNRADPHYMRQLEELPEELRRMWRYGDWDVVVGQYFNEFRREQHVMEPRRIPSHWRRYRAIDYGLDALACIWGAISPEGELYIYRECQVSDAPVHEAARRILELTPSEERIYLTLAPPDIWGRSQESGQRKADLFREAGLTLTRSSNDREAGWLAIKELLALSPGGAPRLHIFSSCQLLIRNLPLLMRDALHPTDCATEPHEVTHDLEGVKGYTKLKKAALTSTSEARRREIVDQYVSQYEGAQPYTEWLGNRAGTAATWAEYLKAFPMVDGELIEREVVARAVADKLGSVRFIDKYAERNVLSRAINSLRRLFRALKTAKADETSIAEVVKLGRAFEGAMSKERTEGRGVRTSAHDVAEDTQKYDMSEKNAEYARKFRQSIDAWDQMTIGFSLEIGQTPVYLAELETNGEKIGTKQVRIDASKLMDIMDKHSEMTLDVIKQLPYLLNDPILVFDSKTEPGRLVLFGEVYANGQPVMMVLEPNATTRVSKTSFIDVVKVASAYVRNSTQSLISTSNVRYVNKNRSRVDDWLKVNRLQLPLLSTSGHSADSSVSQPEQNVNSNSKNNLEKNPKYDLAEGEPAKKAEKKAAGEADAAAKAEKAERRRAERQQSAETMQTEQEEISARRSGRVYRADYVKGVTREVRKIYGNVFDATMSRRLSGKLHEYFNLYDEKTAVQRAMRAISELYVDQRVNYEKKLAQNELDIEKALREGKTPPKRLEPLPELSELSRQNGLAEQYLRRAYKQGGERVDGGYSYQTKNDRELNQLRTENETLKTVSNIRTQINAIKKRAEGYKRVGSNFGQDMDAVMKSAGGVLHGTTVNVTGAINFANEVLHMLRNEAPDMVALMEAINREGGLSDDMLSTYQEKLNASKTDNDVAQIFDDVTQDLINIANIGQYYTEGEQRKVTPTRGLTLEELKTIEKTMREVIAADTRHGRVYIDGEWVDAIPFAELTVGAASKVYGAGKDVMLRTMTSTGMIETIQPAMLMQVLEGTAGDRHSSLSTMYNEIMQADLDRQVQRVELTKDIDEFMNDGKEINGVKMGGRKYQKHYSTDSITVELPIPGRGKVAVNMTIGEAQAFVMTFKREQARPTFALNAFEFRDRKKRGKDYTGRVIERMEIAEDADYDDVMTRLLNEIGKTVAEVSRQLTDEDRALMRMAEKFFEQSKTIKMGADMTLLGKTNIIAGYYFPILRSALGRDANYINSGVAEYSPSTRSYSWNKKTIRNASGRIVIGELLDIVNSHAEQLTTYANMSIPIQNLQRMVNTRLAEPVSDCRTVREYISRRVYAGFDKYMNKLISDLQGRRIGNELDAKIESALGHRTVVQSPITSFKLEKH